MRTVGFIILGVGVLLFVTSLVLMVVFKVPELIDELSGRKAKRQIKRLKELNEGTGAVEGMATEDFYMSAGGYSITSDMADINDSIVSDSKRLDTSSDIGEDTDNQQPKEDIAADSEDDEESATEMVDDSDEEDFDAEEASTEMVDDSDEEDSPTDLIDEDDQPTDLLSEEDETSKADTHIITILEEQSSIDQEVKYEKETCK